MRRPVGVNLVALARRALTARSPLARGRPGPRRGALAVLVAGGVALRVWYMRSYRPGFLGYPDAVTYVIAARGPLFWNPYRPAGYALVLRALHSVDRRLAVAVGAQHAAGVAAALVLFDLTDRTVRRRELALLPAAVVLFGGTQVALEHAVMPESTYTLLLAAALWCATRSVPSRSRAGWLAGAGCALGASSTLRSAGLLVVPGFTAWAVASPGPPRERARAAGALLAGALLGLLPYLLCQHAVTGRWALTRTNAFTLYARMAPLADCRRFTPPAGTEQLCEGSDPRGRPNATWYMFEWAASPALRRYGVPSWPRAPVARSAYVWEGEAPLRRFALAVLRHQPGDYAASVARGMANYVRPHSSPPGVMGWDHDRLLAELHDPGFERAARDEVASYYAGPALPRGSAHALDRYARAVKLEGAATAALAVPLLAGMVLSGGKTRATAVLVGGTTLTTATALVALLFYDVRYATPLYGPLAVGAALGLDHFSQGGSRAP